MRVGYDIELKRLGKNSKLSTMKCYLSTRIHCGHEMLTPMSEHTTGDNFNAFLNSRHIYLKKQKQTKNPAHCLLLVLPLAFFFFFKSVSEEEIHLVQVYYAYY